MINMEVRRRIPLDMLDNKLSIDRLYLTYRVCKNKTKNKNKLERFSAFAVFRLRGWWRMVVGFKAIVV